MRKSLRASVLVLALTLTARAGEIPCPPVAPPPPSAAEEATTDGEMHYPLVQLALDLFGLI